MPLTVYEIEEGSKLVPRFDKHEYLPCITLDATSGEVLMLGYMNPEALQKTIETKKATYYSRQRKKLWVKGEQSGLTQHVVNFMIDDDQDCFLIKVRVDGGASCHVGYRSCFFRELKNDSMSDLNFTIKEIAQVCNIAYKVQNDVVYKPKSDECVLFNKLNKSILSVDCLVGNLRAISCISTDGKTLVISIAGLEQDIKESLYELDAEQVLPYDEHENIISTRIRFHKGLYMQFIDMLDNIKELIDDFLQKGKLIILCGHSMGGCIASMIAFYLKSTNMFTNIHVTTFGMPIFTNLDGSQWFEQNIRYIRVQIDRDPVPRIPINANYTPITHTHVFIKNKHLLINPSNAEEKCSAFLRILLRKKIDNSHHNIIKYINNITI